MKKFIIFMSIIIILLIIIIFLYFKDDIFFIENNEIDSTNSLKISNTTSLDISVEKELASYSTEIKDDSEGRLTNISITCSALNNSIIKPGDEFSFNSIVGEPTTEKGYQEATVIIDDDYETGIGGGNCQVSSTLYNAVLAVSTLEVTERNDHGLPVAYVPEGKDAAVSYSSSQDFKFKNNSNKKIKIELTNDNKTITAKIFQI